MKKAWLQILLLILMGTSSALAADFKRFEFQPFGGFTANSGIPLRADDNTAYGTVAVDNSYSIGATFGVNLNELDAVEGLWRRQHTKGRLPPEMAAPVSPGGLTSFNMNIDQYHCNFLHHYQIAVSRVMPYVMGGLGATTYTANRNGRSSSMTGFSFALGGGVKYFLTSHFGFRGEARWAPTLLWASDGGYWCNIGGAGATCGVHLQAAFQSQLDLTGGIVFRF